jgi:hypothetical protein
MSLDSQFVLDVDIFNLRSKPIIGNLIWLPGAYAPSTKKIYFEMSKKFDKKLYIYITIIYVCSSGFEKNRYFLWSI